MTRPRQFARAIVLLTLAARAATGQCTTVDVLHLSGDPDDQLGASLDLDGDRLAVGDPRAQPIGFQFAGGAYVFDRVGDAWTLVASLLSGTGAGQSVAVDGGLLAVGVPGYSGSYPGGLSPNLPFAVVYREGPSGWTLEGLPTSPSQAIHDFTGWSVDVEDGCVLVGAPGASDEAGRARVYGHDGAGWVQEVVLDGGGAFGQLGRAVALSGGRAAIGAPQTDTSIGAGTAATTRVGPGHVLVRPLEEGATLRADVLTASLASGGAQALALETCPPTPGELHLLAGSLSGTTPGISVDGLVVPLVLDAYTTWLLANPNPPHLAGSFGVLGPAGSGSATFVLPPGSNPAWAGATVHHAAVVLAAPQGPLQATLVSEAVPLALQP